MKRHRFKLKKKTDTDDRDVNADREIAQRHHAKRNELMEQVLLGLDDGTPEAAFDESVDFSRFESFIDDEIDAQAAQQRLYEAPEPYALQMLKKRCESKTSLRTRYR